MGKRMQSHCPGMGVIQNLLGKIQLQIGEKNKFASIILTKFKYSCNYVLILLLRAKNILNIECLFLLFGFC